MIVYAAAAVLSAALAYLLGIREAQTVNVRSFRTYVPLLPYLLVAMLRDGVGKDTVGEWSTYPRAHALIADGSSFVELNRQLRIEPGYYVLDQVVVGVGGGPELVYALASAIFLGFTYRFIIEQSPKIPLSLILLFLSDIFMFSLSGIRQAVATAIAFYALKYVTRRQVLPFLAYMALAASFHVSVLIFLPLYLLGSRRIRIRWVAALAVISLVLNAVPAIARSAVGLVYGDAYFGSKWDYANFNLVPAVATAIIAITALAYRRRASEQHPSADLYLVIMVTNAFLMSISATLITPIRFYFLLIPVTFVLIPIILQAARVKTWRQRAALSTMLVTATSLQLAYEVAIGNDAYGTWDYHWLLGRMVG